MIIAMQDNGRISRRLLLGTCRSLRPRESIPLSLFHHIPSNSGSLWKQITVVLLSLIGFEYSHASILQNFRFDVKIKRSTGAKSFGALAGMAGFEPTVTESKSVALTAWLHPCMNNIGKEKRWPSKATFNGVDNRIRTDGLQCHKLAL